MSENNLQNAGAPATANADAGVESSGRPATEIVEADPLVVRARWPVVGSVLVGWWLVRERDL